MGLDATSVLLDITPYTFGTSAIGEVDGIRCSTMFVPLIRRNTKLPAAQTEAFYTLYDDQEKVEIKVYQGEEPDALDNIQIGKYMFKLTKGPEGSVILIHFDLDLNGILKIEAIEKATGRKINAVIENAFSKFSEEELSESKKRIEEMWGEATDTEDMPDAGDGDSAAAAAMPPDLAEILGKAQSKLDAASDEDQDEMVNLMEDGEINPLSPPLRSPQQRPQGHN